MFSFEGAESPRKYAPVAQLVEQLTLNQWVLGSSPCRCTKWPIGQVVKTAASHAVNIGSNPVWVTKMHLTKADYGATILGVRSAQRF